MISFDHKSIRFFEKIILVFISIFNFFRNKNNLRILVYHHVEKKDFKKLYNQLKSLKKHSLRDIDFRIMILCIYVV